MANPIRIGLVGLGRAGWGMHLEEIKNKEDRFQVVAACDIIPERNQKIEERLGCRTYTDIQDLINDPEVELVDIATRTCDHFAHAKMALLAGKDVQLEKPACQNVEQLKELLTLANGKGQPRLFFRQNRRFETCYSEAKEIMDSGILGNVFDIELDQMSYQRRDDWQTLNEFGGGQLLNWGPHLTDHALMLLESPVKEIRPDLKHAVAGGDCEDHFTITLIGENGRTARVCISGAAALNPGRKYTVYGTRGALEIQDRQLHLRYIDPEQVLPPVVADPGTPGMSFGASGTFSSTVEPKWIEEKRELKKQDLTAIWDALYETYREGKPFPIKDEQVVALMTVLTQGKESSLYSFN